MMGTPGGMIYTTRYYLYLFAGQILEVREVGRGWAQLSQIKL